MDIDKVISQNDSLQKALSHLKAEVKSNRLRLEMYRDAGKEFATNNLFSDDSFKSLSKGAYKLIHGFGTSVNFDELNISKDLGLKPVNSFTSDYLVPKYDTQFKSQFKHFRKPFCVSPNKGFPCGKCLYCLERKRKPWIVRLTEERKYWHRVGVSTYFITLTYAPEHLPKDGVVKSHLQNFFKRLRQSYKAYGDNSLKYFAVSEYGTKSHRPHYHIILFGFNQRLSVLQTLVSKHWSFGFNQVTLIKSTRINYVTKYSVKLADDFNPPTPEFRLISKGLGLKFLDARQVNHFINNPDKLFITVDGAKYSLPRYYRDKIFGHNLVFKSGVLLDSICNHLKFLDFYTKFILPYDAIRFANHLPSFYRDSYNRDLKAYKDYINKHKIKI